MINDYQTFLGQEAERQGVPADLAQYVGHTESRFNPNAVSHAGARGLMQLMPATGAALGLHTAADFFDPYKNMTAGVANLAQLSRQFHGNRTAMLIGYNAGPRWANDYLSGRITFAQLPRETQAYVQGYNPGAIHAPPVMNAAAPVALPVGQRYAANPFVPPTPSPGGSGLPAVPTYGSSIFAPGAVHAIPDFGRFNGAADRNSDSRPDYFATTGII